MSRTRRDLVNEALMNLGVLAAGQTADAEDFTAVDGKYNGLIAFLEKTDVLDLDNTVDEIPDEVFNPLAVLLADEAALEFGMPGVPAKQGDQNPVLTATTKLRLVAYGRPTYQRQRTEYF